MPSCALLHNHLCMGTDNKWRVCCKFQGEPRPDIQTTTFEQFKSSEKYKEIINTMKTGWHPGCVICKVTEEDGKVESLRQTSNREFSLIGGIESIELSLSIDCNLRCRMCGPKYSTKWVDMIQNNPPIIQTQQFDPYDENKPFKQFSVYDILHDKDLTRLQTVKFLGGEPFVSQQITDLFNYLNDLKIIHNIDFQTNTNCTMFPEKLVKQLSKFRRIVVTLSIDGYGDLNDYIRDGRPWKSIIESLDKWKQFRNEHHNCILLISPSVQAYNIHDIKNLKQFADDNNIKFKLQYVRSPKHFSIDALPPKYLNSIKTQINSNIIKTSIYDTKQFELFKKFTKMLDLANHKDLRDYVPSLAKYVY